MEGTAQWWATCLENKRGCGSGFDSSTFLHALIVSAGRNLGLSIRCSRVRFPLRVLKVPGSDGIRRQVLSLEYGVRLPVGSPLAAVPLGEGAGLLIPMRQVRILCCQPCVDARMDRGAAATRFMPDHDRLYAPSHTRYSAALPRLSRGSKWVATEAVRGVLPT